MRKIICFCSGFTLILFFTSCGNVNFFSWAHSRGSSSSSAAALTADAEAAFADQDYAKAEDYYAKVLEKDPNSSAALYGESKSAYASAGLGFASIISNMSDVNTSAAPSLSKKNAPLQDAVDLISPAYSNKDIFEGLDSNFLKNLYRASKKGIKNLRKIAEGKCDGKLKPDNANININLAISLLLNGALRLLDTNGDEKPMSDGDIIKLFVNNGNYELKIKTISEGYLTFKDFSDTNLGHDQTWQESQLTSAEKQNIKLQLRIFIMYLVGNQPADISIATTFGNEVIPDDDADGLNTKFKTLKVKGSIDYLLIALNAMNMKKEKGVIDDLKKAFKEFASDSTNQNGLREMWDKFKNYN